MRIEFGRPHGDHLNCYQVHLDRQITDQDEGRLRAVPGMNLVGVRSGPICSVNIYRSLAVPEEEFKAGVKRALSSLVPPVQMALTPASFAGLTVAVLWCAFVGWAILG